MGLCFVLSFLLELFLTYLHVGDIKATRYVRFYSKLNGKVDYWMISAVVREPNIRGKFLATVQ